MDKNKGSKRIIVFAPHPDDETLGCGGTIIKKIKEGCNISLVFITDGTKSASKKIRREEAKAAAHILGVKKRNIVFLGFEDMSLERNKYIVQEKVIEILKEQFPVEVYFTLKEDAHSDHSVLNSIVKNSIETLSLHVIMYQYIIWTNTIWPLWKIIYFVKHNLINVDISEFLHLKRRAMEKYKSQRGLMHRWWNRSNETFVYESSPKT